MRNVRTSFFILFFVGLLSSCLSTDLTSFVSSLGNVTSQEAFTNSEAIEAMKDALVEGITVSASELSTTDGYFGDSALKIFLPEKNCPNITRDLEDLRVKYLKHCRLRHATTILFLTTK